MLQSSRLSDLINKCLVRISQANEKRVHIYKKPAHFVDWSRRSLSGDDNGQFPQGNHCDWEAAGLALWESGAGVMNA